MGDPMRPLRWVSKSHAKLAAACARWGTKSQEQHSRRLLGLLQYRRQVNRKTLESVTIRTGTRNSSTSTPR